jgi:hypothetical protein
VSVAVRLTTPGLFRHGANVRNCGESSFQGDE